MLRRTGLEVAAAVVAGVVLGTGAHLLSAADGATTVAQLPAAQVAGRSVERVGAVADRVVESSARSVLHVEASGCGQDRQASATLLRTADGDVRLVTNAHVVRGTSSVTVRTRVGEQVQVDVLGVVAGRDAALLDPEPLERHDDVEPAPVGSATEVGDEVVLVGHPGAAFSVRPTLVEDVQRRVAFGTASDVVLVGATVTGGASGGAVLDTRGAVLGLVAARDPGTGRAVAHPVDGVLDAALRGQLSC